MEREASTNYQNSCRATASTGGLLVVLVFMVNYENRCEIKLRTFCCNGSLERRCGKAGERDGGSSRERFIKWR